MSILLRETPLTHKHEETIADDNDPLTILLALEEQDEMDSIYESI